MLDVIHYFFEEDALWSTSAEHADAKDAVRSQVYETMYGRPYSYAAGASRSSNLDDIDFPIDDSDVPQPVDPFARSNSVKPFTPATNFNPEADRPFGQVLDAPMG